LLRLIGVEKMNQIFISYAKEDRPTARQIYEELRQRGFSAWLDVCNLRPGQDWQVEIKKAIKNSTIFLACLSKHAVTKRGFVQSELKLALKILDTIPEDEIYLIPIRLDQCVIPSRLEHLQWVDYFEADGPGKLFDTLREYLGHSIGEQATDTASGPLKFSSIRIDANDPNWGEGIRDGSPFDRPCSQYFRLVKLVYNADPLFDIILMNAGKLPAILTEIGIEVLTVCQRTYVYGFPTAAKIPKSDSYIRH
jgi:TIR domain